MLVNSSEVSLVVCDGMPGDTPGLVVEAFLLITRDCSCSWIRVIRVDLFPFGDSPRSLSSRFRSDKESFSHVLVRRTEEAKNLC